MAPSRKPEADTAMKRIILTRLTGTPEARAAGAEPPAANIQLPKRVFVRMIVATITTPIHQAKLTSSVPNSLPLKRWIRGSSPIAVFTPPT